MSGLTQVKLGLAIAGLALFGYGVRAELEWMRWTGIAFLAAAVLVRFFGPRSSRRSPYDDSEKPDR